MMHISNDTLFHVIQDIHTQSSGNLLYETCVNQLRHGLPDNRRCRLPALLAYYFMVRVDGY
jgi:hypothetical protein